MMAPGMLKTSHSENQGQEQMIKTAVSEMALNRGSYNLVELGRVETDNRAFSEKMFKEVIVNQIAASGQMVLTEPSQEQAAAAGLTDEDQQTRAILDAELLRLESQDRLELKLRDARSGRIVWGKTVLLLATFFIFTACPLTKMRGLKPVCFSFLIFNSHKSTSNS